MKQIIYCKLFLILIIHSDFSYAGWEILYQEDFEKTGILQPEEWQEDTFPQINDKDRYSEKGSYFTDQCIESPKAYRLTTSFGQADWLTAESYTRNRCTDPKTLLSIEADPAGNNNKVLRLSSPEHTDATLIRSSQQLKGKYRISMKVGFPNFGNGEYPNGYDGGETAAPWLDQTAINENGFYWLAIADTIPRPHNNIWWHHHRKIVIDTDNHFPAWMEIWNGIEFISSGKNPIMMFALDGKGKSDPKTGKPFISFSDWKWQPSGEIKAVDAYLPDQWYDVEIERDQDSFTLKLSGRFAHGGYRDYVATINIRQNHIWHHNRQPEQTKTNCQNKNEQTSHFWPDYFYFGDPHINYYEGEVYYDDIKVGEYFQMSLLKIE